MKKYIIINGKQVYIIERRTKEKAIEYAENVMNHSHEIIVREIENITDHTKVFINQ